MMRVVGVEILARMWVVIAFPDHLLFTQPININVLDVAHASDTSKRKTMALAFFIFDIEAALLLN